MATPFQALQAELQNAYRCIENQKLDSEELRRENKGLKRYVEDLKKYIDQITHENDKLRILAARPPSAIPQYLDPAVLMNMCNTPRGRPAQPNQHQFYGSAVNGTDTAQNPINIGDAGSGIIASASTATAPTSALAGLGLGSAVSGAGLQSLTLTTQPNGVSPASYAHQHINTPPLTPTASTFAASASPPAFDINLFILRKNTTEYLDTSVPVDLYQPLKDCISSWNTVQTQAGAKNTWLANLHKTGLRPAKNCLNCRFLWHNTATVWTIENEAMFACLRCTKTGISCSIWDHGKRKIVVLPLEPSVRTSQKPEDRGYWLTSEIEMQRTAPKYRELFGKTGAKVKKAEVEKASSSNGQRESPKGVSEKSSGIETGGPEKSSGIEVGGPEKSSGIELGRSWKSGLNAVAPQKSQNKGGSLADGLSTVSSCQRGAAEE